MGLLNKWLNGLAKLSPAIGRFYNENRKNQKELVITLQDAILPCLADSAMATQEIHALLIGDNSISQRKKEELCAGYSCENDTEEAKFIADVLIFGMVRPFQPHDVRRPNLLTGVVFAVSTALGFGLALTIFAAIREQLAMMDIPKGMQGMPIALVVAGLLAMAFMGFGGVDNGLAKVFGL